MQFNQLKIPTNEINLNVVVEGKGTPIIFVHGWPESFYSWRHQISTFSKLGYTVIAPDIRGYGDSEKPTNVFDYSMKKITADLIGILDYLGEKKAHIIGHDWVAPSCSLIAFNFIIFTLLPDHFLLFSWPNVL